MKLYEMVDGVNKIQEMIEEGAENEALFDTLEALELEIEDKAENMAFLIKNLEADAEAIKAEEKRLSDRRKSIENKVEYVKQYLKESLEMVGMTKVKRPTITIAIQNNPYSVEIADESIIPIVFMIPQYKVDKKAILQLLKEGQEVAGCSLKQTQSLRIR